MAAIKKIKYKGKFYTSLQIREITGWSKSQTLRKMDEAINQLIPKKVLFEDHRGDKEPYVWTDPEDGTVYTDRKVAKIANITIQSAQYRIRQAQLGKFKRGHLLSVKSYQRTRKRKPKYKLSGHMTRHRQKTLEEITRQGLASLDKLEKYYPEKTLAGNLR